MFEIFFQFQILLLDSSRLIFVCIYSARMFYLQKQLPEVFYKKDIIKNFAIFTGKRLCWSLLLIKLLAWTWENWLKFYDKMDLPIRMEISIT